MKNEKNNEVVDNANTEVLEPETEGNTELPAAGRIDLGDDFMASNSRGGGSKISASVGYTLTGRPKTKLPLQAKVIVSIINRNTSDKKPALSEVELHDLLVKAKESGELVTTQTAWRIFQYYRPRLVDPKEAGCLKKVGMAQVEQAAA